MCKCSLECVPIKKHPSGTNSLGPTENYIFTYFEGHEEREQTAKHSCHLSVETIELLRLNCCVSQIYLNITSMFHISLLIFRQWLVYEGASFQQTSQQTVPFAEIQK